MIISLCNQKGGVGKTTIAINLAYAMTLKNKKTLVIDTDPQASAINWKDLSNNQTFDVIHYPKEDIYHDIKQLTKGYKIIILDAPPALGNITMAVLLASNLAIIPIEPSALSIWASTDIVGLIKEAKKHNRRLKSRLLVSKKVIGTVPARDVRSALQQFKIPIFKTEISHRIDYVRSFIDGLTVQQYSKNEPSKEIESLCNEIFTN